MTDTTQPPAETRDRLTPDEQMQDAQKGCAPCALCGGHAIINDAGSGAGYFIRCSNSLIFKASEGCLIEQRRLGGWAYNVMDWWNRLHTAALTRRAGGDAITAGEQYSSGYAQGQADAEQLNRWMQDKAWQDTVLMLVHYKTLAERTWLVGHEVAAAKLAEWWGHARTLSETKSVEDIAATPKPPAGGDAGTVAALIQWARDQMALPDGSGWLGGHIDENHRYKLRDLVGAIDAARQDTAALALPAPVVEGATCKDSLHVPPVDVVSACGRIQKWMDDEHRMLAPGEAGAGLSYDDVTTVLRAALSEGRSHG